MHVRARDYVRRRAVIYTPAEYRLFARGSGLSATVARQACLFYDGRQTRRMCMRADVRPCDLAEREEGERMKRQDAFARQNNAKSHARRLPRELKASLHRVVHAAYCIIWIERFEESHYLDG